MYTSILDFDVYLRHKEKEQQNGTVKNRIVRPGINGAGCFF